MTLNTVSIIGSISETSLLHLVYMTTYDLEQFFNLAVPIKMIAHACSTCLKVMSAFPVFRAMCSP